MQINLEQYLQLNSSFKEEYIYRFGDSAGFFSEYNNMVLTMVWCLLHHYQFALQSKNANFSKTGWNIFFKPFIEERYDDFINKQNYRYSSPIQPYYDRYKSIYPHTHFMFEFFEPDMRGEMSQLTEENKILNIPELELKGTVLECCSVINEMIWHYNEKMENIKQQFIKALRLPEEYVSLHIQKYNDGISKKDYSIDDYMIELQKYSSCKNIFVLTDDYSIIIKLKEKYQDYNFYTLCSKNENGYNMNKYLGMLPTQRLTALAKLLTSLDIIGNSKEFVGTYSTNSGMFLGFKMMQNRMHCLDFKNWKTCKNKKIVLYDNQVFDLQSIGGISKQFTELIKNLQKYNPIVAVKETSNLYLCKYLNKQMVRANNFDYSLQVEAEQKYDLIHATYFYDTLLSKIGNKPFVFTIHDLIIEKFTKDISKLSGDGYAQVYGRKNMAKRANAIIAVSENTKKDIIEILHIPEEKIYVCYQGIDKGFGNLYNKDLANQLNFQYILYVGTRLGTKHFLEFVNNCCQALHKKYPNIKILCTHFDFSNEELSLFKSLGLQDMFIHYFAETEDQLATLYKHALCFIFPSIYEGFGIPTIEAMSCNCPVLLNRTSCFPEIGGDAALYFDLYDDKNNFLEVFNNFMNMSKEDLNDLKQKGKERSKLFTWDQFAQQVEKVYDTVLEKNNEK